MRPRAPASVAAALFLLAAAACCAAEPRVEISFPLQGYYRVGKYMPVRVVAEGGAAPVEVRAGGAVTVSVERGNGGVDVVVPWLAVTRVRAARWAVGGSAGEITTTLTPLEAQDVAVGVAGTDVAGASAAATELFPGKTVILIALHSTQPLPGEPAAWEALDAVVLDSAPDDEAAGRLLAAGVAIAARSAEKPASKWNWHGAAGRWVLRRPVAGPQGSIDAAAYDPTYAWKPGWPAGIRRRVVLAAVVFCAIATAATLWRSRKAAVVVVAVSAASAAGFLTWGSGRQETPRAAGTVVVADNLTTQIDLWEYAKPLAAGPVAIEWSGHTRPLFASARHFEAAAMRLEIAAGGRPVAFRWEGRRGATMAFVSRSVRPEVVGFGTALAPAEGSPLRELVRGSYLSAGESIRGDVWIGPPGEPSEWTTLWPSVLVQLGR